MSHHLSNLAWEKDLPHARKIVLLALAHYANQATGECFPSVRALAAKSGLSESATRAQIKHLEDIGLVEQPEMPPGAPVVYRVLLGRVE